MSRPLQKLQRFLRELKRRNVYKVAIGYLVAAFVALQAADLLVPETTLPAGTETVIVYLTIAGFPISLVIAWAFEVTPEGVRRTPASGAEEADTVEGTGRSGPWAVKAFVGLGIVAAAVAGGWYLMGGGGSAPSEPDVGARSVAVLPFDALSTGKESQTFARGIHDDLLTRLAHISSLTVLSRQAVEKYRDAELTAGAIADSLGVRWVVQGGVQKLEDQIQVNAQLVDPRTEAQRWADSYRRDLTADDLFALQSEITKRIARSLEAELTAEETRQVERRPTGDLEAYRLYVKGRDRLDARTEAGMREAVDYFQRAIEQDSSYALAWSGLADARSLLAYYGYASPDSVSSLALEAARRAVELNPELAEAHASLGTLYQNYLKDLPAALRELERAVQLKPSYAPAHQWLVELMGALDRPDLALAHAQKAVDLNPHSPVNHLVLGVTYWWIEGPREKALDHVRKAAELEPGYALAHVDEGLILSHMGRQEEAVTALRRALDRAGEGSLAWMSGMAGLGVAHARAGDTARSRKLLIRLEQRGSDPFHRARIHAALGDDDAAFQALRDMEWEVLWKRWDLRFFPEFSRLSVDPRYEEVIRAFNRQWGLNPDGSLPDSVDVSFGSESGE